MRAACIDIGSNTTRLLVAEVGDGTLTVVTQEKAFTQVGRALRDTGEIGAAKIAEVIRAVRAQLEIARADGAVECRAVGTAALRCAADGDQLVAELGANTGLSVQILSTAEEARLAFVGAVGMLERAPTGSIGVVDVGGGSSEVAIGEVGRPVSWSKSIALGSGSLTDAWLHSDPPAPDELLAALEYVRAEIAGVLPPKPNRALAVGGSATSLGRVAGPLLDGPAFARALYLLGSEPSQALGPRIGVDPKRVRLLPAALIVLEALAARLGRPLAVCRGGVREGVLLELGRRRASR